MAKAKYKRYFEQMKQENQELFAQFRSIHDQYQQDRDKHQDQFNQIGDKVVKLVRDWERKLCTVMGKGKYSKYSSKVAEKFWDLVREEFELIDMVGVKIEKVDVSEL
jgi:sugar-specific transcriptional regulator TrmB